MTQTHCKNQFLAEDGFCSMCGQNHFHDRDRQIQTAKRERKARQTQAERIEEINQGIENNPIFKTFRDTVKILSDIYQIPARVVFRNLQGGCANVEAGYIKMGYQCLEGYAKTGFHEYKTIQYLFPEVDGATGELSSKIIASHEFAHLLQFVKDGYTDCHKSRFCKYYREVLDLVL